MATRESSLLMKSSCVLNVNDAEIFKQNMIDCHAYKQYEDASLASEHADYEISNIMVDIVYVFIQDYISYKQVSEKAIIVPLGIDILYLNHSP